MILFNFALQSGLYQYLQNHLSTHIVGQNTHYEDELQLLPIADWQLGFREPYNGSRFPVVSLQQEESVPEEFRTSNGMRVSSQFSLILVHNQGRGDDVVKFTARYVDAVLSLWQADHTLGGLAVLSDITRIEVFPPVSSGRSVGTALVTLNLITQEA